VDDGGAGAAVAGGAGEPLVVQSPVARGEPLVVQSPLVRGEPLVVRGEPLAVLVALLLLWECLELEGGAYLGVGEHRVRGGGELAVAVVSYALP